MKPRKAVAIHFARNFAVALLQNAECCYQQDGSSLTDDEIALAEQEIYRLAEGIEKTINQAHLAKACVSEK